MEVEVTVQFSKSGALGPGWYAWETQYPEDGYVFFSDKGPPTTERLKEVSPDYVLRDQIG